MLGNYKPILLSSSNHIFWILGTSIKNIITDYLEREKNYN